jgi:hypothetical protein
LSVGSAEPPATAGATGSSRSPGRRFEKFEDQRLALVFQEKTEAGEKSNFNKLVSRDS